MCIHTLQLIHGHIYLFINAKIGIRAIKFQNITFGSFLTALLLLLLFLRSLRKSDKVQKGLDSNKVEHKEVIRINILHRLDQRIQNVLGRSLIISEVNLHFMSFEDQKQLGKSSFYEGNTHTAITVLKFRLFNFILILQMKQSFIPKNINKQHKLIIPL